MEASVSAHIRDSSEAFQQMVMHSGKMVLFDKMMEKLKKEGHKVSSCVPSGFRTGPGLIYRLMHSAI